jgi:hypothetical protein
VRTESSRVFQGTVGIKLSGSETGLSTFVDLVFPGSAAEPYKAVGVVSFPSNFVIVSGSRNKIKKDENNYHAQHYLSVEM